MNVLNNETIPCQEHDYQPITYLSTEHTDEPAHIYERQCMICGQKEPTLFRSKEVLSLKYPYKLERIIQQLKTLEEIP